jgi:hypothetical protein
MILLCPAEFPHASESNKSADSLYTDVVLLVTGAKVIGRIIDDDSNQNLVIERRGDLMLLEIPQDKIYRITDLDHYAEVRAEWEHIPRPEPLFTDPEIWTYVGGAHAEDGFSFRFDAVGLYASGEHTRLGLGVGSLPKKDGILKATGVINQKLFGRSLAVYAWGEMGYAVRLGKNPHRAPAGPGEAVSVGLGVRLISNSAGDWIGRLGYSQFVQRGYFSVQLGIAL